MGGVAQTSLTLMLRRAGWRRKERTAPMPFNSATDVVAFPMPFRRASLAGQPRAAVPT
jgi:hypothetical protein